ncbi:CxxC motif-containing protein [Acholeplasma morum]|uniref:DUF1667 domain-containing protein n=1 Tax=Paracholeplasma morum TaxID=264637 RepID=UPI00195B19A2|nr:DUF1667 domain-containing protein [Paracholeplasma morum]MBM7453064.1 CxxC motif-containing protein [Paracholeplasma morum]
MKELTCIVCPVGCHIEVSDEMVPTGNRCSRGAKYAIEEMTAPKRMITSTVKTIFPNLPRLSVKTSSPVPKELMKAILSDLDSIRVENHVKIGDVIIHNIRNTGVDIVSTKTSIVTFLGGAL